MGKHQRANSFATIDSIKASGILADVLRESNVYLGGSSIGKGLKKAAQYYLQENQLNPDYLKLPGAQYLNSDAPVPTEEPFYVIDLGVIVSQVYQWRRYFPRVEPYYAVKCNPDPVIVKTLAILGCNFDCASSTEIRIVQDVSRDLPGRKPEILYANPCKGRTHLLEAVCRGVTHVTFDNVTEVQKCASISKHIKLVLRIITDDRGSQCRLSSKFGAPRIKWKPLLAAAKKYGLQVVGVSFHVGSGCRDASRYEDALNDAREIFDIAKNEFGMEMNILDIGGGFPGETHSMWNPASEIDNDDDEDAEEGYNSEDLEKKDIEVETSKFMYFTEIAEQVSPIIDQLFPSPDVRIIAEPGRYFVAAAATLCCSVVSTRSNEIDTKFEPEPINDEQASKNLAEMSREEEDVLVRQRGHSFCQTESDMVLSTIREELADYSKLFASQLLNQQEFDVYNDKLDPSKEGFDTSSNLLGPPDDMHYQMKHHTVEGLTTSLVNDGSGGDGGGFVNEESGLLTLAAAGEAAVSGIVLQAVADSAPIQDDFAYYINDGVYGAFNNIMFDHASVRPRVLHIDDNSNVVAKTKNGFEWLDFGKDSTGSDQNNNNNEYNDGKNRELFASTVFGPTCDSIDVVARAVLLPKLNVGDRLFFQNMGAYTMAAASAFNGFTPSHRFYVCSVQPEYFEQLIKGPEETAVTTTDVEEKKTD